MRKTFYTWRYNRICLSAFEGNRPLVFIWKSFKFNGLAGSVFFYIKAIKRHTKLTVEMSHFERGKNRTMSYLDRHGVYVDGITLFSIFVLKPTEYQEVIGTSAKTLLPSSREFVDKHESWQKIKYFGRPQGLLSLFLFATQRGKSYL